MTKEELTTKKVDELLENTYATKTAQELMKIEKVERFPLGLRLTDKLFGFPQGYYTIMALTGSGKTWFALWIARQMWVKHKRKSLFLSLEMSEQEIKQRILQQWSDLSQPKFEAGESVQRAIDLMQQDSITVKKIEQNQHNISEIEAYIDAMVEIGIDVLFFDHVHELAGMSNTDKNQGAAEMWSKFFMRIINKYPHLHLFVFAQANGASYNRKVLTSECVKGSKVISEESHFILSLNRYRKDDDFRIASDNMDEDRSVNLGLIKSRKTPQDKISFPLYFGEDGNFYEIGAKL